MELIVIITGLLLTLAVVTLAISQLLPALGEAVERVRIEREAAEASWRIHVEAGRAFEELLSVARRERQSDEPQKRGEL